MKCPTCAAVVLAAGTLAGSALAQSAEIQVSTPTFAHVVGQPVTIRTVVRWTGAPALAEVRGSVVVSGTGSASGFTSDLTIGSLVNLGTFSSMSRVGIDARSTPLFFTGGVPVHPWGNSSGVLVAEYQVQVSSPGLYSATWVPAGPNQGVRLWGPTALIDPTTANLSTLFFVGCCLIGCPADMTHTASPSNTSYGVPNGVLDNEDFFYYLARFAVGDRTRCDLTAAASPGSPGYGIPNGVLNNDDFFYYLTIFAAGC